jgi:hypothetical protein
VFASEFVVKHGIENNEELAHTGDERGLGVFAIGTQPHFHSTDAVIFGTGLVHQTFCAARPGLGAS